MALFGERACFLTSFWDSRHVQLAIVNIEYVNFGIFNFGVGNFSKFCHIQIVDFASLNLARAETTCRWAKQYIVDLQILFQMSVELS